jgi:hypothetical protein
MLRLRLLPFIGFLTIAMVAGGCASEFDKQWKLAGDHPKEASDIQGRWSGKWVAEGSGHSGGLKAVVVRGPDDNYKALFHATFALIFHFDYDFKLTGQPKEGVLSFAGKEDIGGGDGSYTYDGTVTPDRFHCTFKTKDDHGTFDMIRPDAPPTTRVAAMP